MKTTKTKRNYHLKVEVRRGLFAWATLVISIAALVTFFFYFLKLLESGIMISFISRSAQTLTGITAKMKADLELNKEIQDHACIMLFKFIPLYLTALFTVYIWDKSFKSFIRSLLFK